MADKSGLMVQGLALLVGAYIVAFKYSWALTLASSSTGLFVSVVFSIIVPIYLKMLKSVEESNTGASAVASEVLKSIRTVKSLCAEAAVIKRYATWVSKARDNGLRIVTNQRRPVHTRPLVYFCQYGSNFLVWGEVVQRGTYWQRH
jgi:ATP-binding cassette, subfamily B (MDR/TAP), member 1